MDEAAKERDELQWQLPTYDHLVQRFSLFSASSRCNTQIGYGGSLDCKCDACSKWHAFVEGRSPDCKEVQYEVFTVEHVKGLAHYLLVQAAEYNLPLMNVLEVGAGSGRLCDCLTYFISQFSLPSQGCPVHLTATDSGERGLNGPKVLKQDAIQAISEEKPHVVLVSWMPIGIDWTAHMRATPSVLEYILIGEVDSGICGDPWLTWGHSEGGGLISPPRMSSELRSASKFHSKSQEFSNYGPGKPVDMVQVEPKISLAESCGSQCGSAEQVDCSTVKGTEENLDEIIRYREQQPQALILGGSQRQKRRRMGVRAPLVKNSKYEGVCGNITVPKRQQSFARLDYRDENAQLQIPSYLINVDVLKVAPYIVDGWARTEIETLSAVQICRTDERWSTQHHSHTVSFKRISSIF